VQGLNAVPVADQPPVNVVRFTFQTMVGIGTMLALLGVVYLYVRLRHKRLPSSRWFYRAVVLAGPLSVIALWAVWITTEVGRQPGSSTASCAPATPSPTRAGSLSAMAR
jgi:cytochrome d ubiquinol oxidase subunit I